MKLVPTTLTATPFGAAVIAAQIGWTARHAHNGFLDIALDLGAVGLLIFAVPLGVYATRIARGVASGMEPVARAWPAIFLFYWMMSNLTESPLVRHDHLGWALYVSTVASLGGNPPFSRSIR